MMIVDANSNSNYFANESYAKCPVCSMDVKVGQHNHKKHM